VSLYLLPPKRILLTALGKRPQQAKYRFAKHVETANLVPVALMKLLPEDKRPNEIVALCTEDASRHAWPELEPSVGVEARNIPIPSGTSENDLWAILQIILREIPSGSKLILDITHGFRSVPFLFFTAALFLKALRGVQIEGIYYGMLDARDQDDVAPVVDVNPVLEMIEWFYATRIFKETGQAHLLSACLAPFASPPEGLEKLDYRLYGGVKNLRRKIMEVANLFAQALPIELGSAACKLVRILETPVPEHLQTKVPVPEELFQVLKEFVEPLAFVGGVPCKRRDYPLTLQELERQANLIDIYLERGYVSFAIGLMREWIISAVLFYQGSKDWLKYKQRLKVERRLGALLELRNLKHKRNVPGLLNDEQNRLVEHWHYLAGHRNRLMHYGMKEENAYITGNELETIKSCWEQLKERLHEPSMWQIDLPAAGGLLLVSPIGLSRGTLYSALKHVQPDCLLLIASAGAEERYSEAAVAAGWQGQVVFQKMRDPFAGFDEIQGLVENVVTQLLTAEKIVVNMTGGTTAMQFAAQEIYERAKGLDREVSRIALVDRRSPEEQQANPYLLGEIIELA